MGFDEFGGSPVSSASPPPISLQPTHSLTQAGLDVKAAARAMAQFMDTSAEHDGDSVTSAGADESVSSHESSRCWGAHSVNSNNELLEEIANAAVMTPPRSPAMMPAAAVQPSRVRRRRGLSETDDIPSEFLDADIEPPAVRQRLAEVVDFDDDNDNDAHPGAWEQPRLLSALQLLSRAYHDAPPRDDADETNEIAQAWRANATVEINELLTHADVDNRVFMAACQRVMCRIESMAYNVNVPAPVTYATPAHIARIHHPPADDFDPKNEHLNRINDMQRIIIDKQLMTYAGNMYQPLFTNAGEFMHVFTPMFVKNSETEHLSIAEYLSGLTCYAGGYSALADAAKNRVLTKGSVADSLGNTNDIPKLTPDRYMQAFQNGIYFIDTNEFFRYGSVPATFATRGTIKLHNHAFDTAVMAHESFVDIPTPTLDKILDYQGFGRDHRENYAAFFGFFIGRMLYEMHAVDSWQASAFIIGASGVGKSTIVDCIKAFYPSSEVCSLVEIEAGFPLATAYQKLVLFFNEMSAKVQLNVETFKSMASGEAFDVFIKHKTAISLPHGWKIPFMFIGNEAPEWNDAEGSVSRRIIYLQFRNIVPSAARDMTIPDKLRKELSAILVKSVRAYRWMVHKSNGMDIWESMPATFKDMRDSETDKRSASRAFLNDPAAVSIINEAGLAVLRDPRAKAPRRRIRMEQGMFVTKDRLYNAFTAWCQANDSRDPESKSEFNAIVLQLGILYGRVNKTGGGREYGYTGIKLANPPNAHRDNAAEAAVVDGDAIVNDGGDDADEGDNARLNHTNLDWENMQDLDLWRSGILRREYVARRDALAY